MIFKKKKKIDDSFHVGNFVVEGFSTLHRLDSDNNDGGIMLYVREDIPSNLLVTKEKFHVESLHVELNLRSKKWLINCFYNPNKTIISSHFDALRT